jgi:aerobic carbon-monoxide dehydrogenase small subunit
MIMANTHQIRIKLNGTDQEAKVEPRLLLVHLLRDVLGFTGTHVGCDTTSCGACTVLFNHRPIKSCTMFAVQAEGADVTTIEGLAKDGKLHPVQEAFRENHGLQCGFCTPGMIMTAVDMIRRKPQLDRETIRHELEGNICRCTGYHNIVSAIEDASRRMAGGAK